MTIRERVLIVDDDMTACLLMRESLEQAGFDVEQAHSGQQGLAICEKWAPTIIVSDVSMPEMDGFEFCSIIRTNGSSIPIIMATGLEDLDSINHAYQVGATDFITKPINYTILEHRIKYILRAYKDAQSLAENQERLAWAQNVARMGYWELDTDSYAVLLSDEIFEMLKLDPGNFDFQLDSCISLVHEEDREDVLSALKQTYENDIPCNIRHRIHAGEAEIVVNLQARRKLTDKNVRTNKIRGLIQDITAQKQANDQIDYLKLHDALTGLPNKQLFIDYATKALSLSQRQKALVGLFCIDIDQFRRVNETLGPKVGDLILKEVVSRFLQMIRESDTLCTAKDIECATLARNSGNTFNMLLVNVGNIQDFVIVANRIEDRFCTAFEAGEDEIVLTASIGISVSPMDGDNVNTLLKNAETAMYHARRESHGSHKFYSVSMNDSSLNRFKLETRLRIALEQESLELYYQPQFQLPDKNIIGMEALLRWNDAELGRVSPGEFIPLAEEVGLITGLTEFVVARSCEEAKRWIDQFGIDLRIGVNISSHSLQDPGFIAFISQVLQNTQLDAKHLELEITEGSIMHDVDAAIDVLHKLRALGLTLSIDDFGTGYSSFSYLHQFPVNTLKIDQSFIRDMDEGSGNRKIVNALIGLAHSLQLNVIAEGVETEPQLQYLAACGCDEIQGFYLSKPLPSSQFETFVRKVM